MNIGIDARLWNETGVGRYIRNLVVELGKIDKENQYVLFGLSKDASSIRALVSDHGSFIFIEANIRWHSLREQFEFPRLLNKYNLDLVHFPYFSVPVFYNKPYVVTVHDLIINNFPTGRASTLPLPIYKLKRYGYNFVLKKALYDSRKVIVPSIATKGEILKKNTIHESKLVVTPEGVDDSISNFQFSIFKEKNPYFLYVGNAYPHKNLEKLIEAFNLFSDRNPDYKLVLVGKKDYFYKKIEKKIKSSMIEFAGFVSDQELAKMYSRATATFIPSLMEGFGLTALEAMKMGSLVACSEIPSLKEVCANVAFYFDPKDTLSILKVMDNVSNLSNNERKLKIEFGEKRIKKYSWEKTALLTLEVYSSSL